MNTTRVTLALVLLGLILLPVPVRAAATIELYGTLHAMGIVVNIAASDDPDGDATAAVEYRVSGGGPYQQGFPLSRIADTRFVGSLFWLEPGTAYDVRVTFSDPGGSLHGVTVGTTASTRAEITVPTPGKSYYVHPGGSGTDCTFASPCSLTVGINQAQPGEEVVLRGGTYYQDEISLPRSGSSGAPIVIRGYAGETAILDGADPDSDSFTWTAYGGGVYYTTVNVSGTHLVTANGQRLFPYNNLTDLQSLSQDSTPGFYADGYTLYVHLAGDANPNGATMVVSRCETAFYVAQDYVYLLNLTFRHYGQGSYPKAIYFNNASDNLVQGCTFAANDIGIGIKYESHRNVIQDNEFYDTIFDWPWDGIKNYAGGGLEDGGIVFYDPVTGRGNVIRRNTFHDDFDGFGICPSGTAAVTNETDVYENLIYNMGDDGVETDGQCSNVRLWGNTFHDVLMGISLAPVYDGPVYAIRNLIYRTGVGNNDYSGSPFKFNSGYGQSGPMYLFHNTSDAALPGNNGIYIKAPGTWQMIYARNNVWAGTDYALNDYNTGQPIDFDYDDLWTDGGGDLVRWDGTRYATLADFTTATGQEAHGLSLEPGFVDAASGVYTLVPGSDLIDAGVLIPGINDDSVGTAPDIGAFEYGTGSPAAVANLRVTDAITAGGVLTATLRWTAPTNAITYTLRYSDTLISDADWPNAITVTVPFTATPGSTEWLTTPVPYAGSAVYFALKSQNAGGDWSPLSNSAFWPHFDVWLPLTIRDYEP
ncbi:MAG: right-handed parallel beta-helix repeat-containing protein [Chloroflexota bacterium]|nr:right-handed parallel beta-helix repeat-containing protein [Chloroflexota bacterium]